MHLDSSTGRDMALPLLNSSTNSDRYRTTSWADGELVMLDEQGRAQRDRLRERHALRDEHTIAERLPRSLLRSSRSICCR